MSAETTLGTTAGAERPTLPVKYRTIVADPPWRTSAGPAHFQARKPTSRNGSTFDSRYSSTSRDLAYPAMDVAAIAALIFPSDDNAHLYLWTINAYIEDAYEVARAWGFTPSTLLTWCKQPRGIGLGGAFTLSTEFVLFARRGSLHPSNRIDSSWWLWKRTARHSAKPDAFYDLVEQVSPGPYLELFARRQRLGWDTWGNEALEHVEMGGVHSMTSAPASRATSKAATLLVEGSRTSEAFPEVYDGVTGAELLVSHGAEHSPSAERTEGV